jgi:LmbE family N-acetylglucosaminyl deacetylase
LPPQIKYDLITRVSKKLSKLTRAVKRRLVPRDARSSIRLWLVGPWEDREPLLVSDFDSSPVLVLAPHPDDEIIGPGGTLVRHRAAKAPVTIAILTDGRWGGYNPDQKLCDRRKEESRQAAKILGIDPPIFFDAPDGELGQTPDIAEKLIKLFREKSPRYVYLPALTDGHPDHWSTNELLHTILGKLPGAIVNSLIIRGYEVWTPALANCCVDITSAADLKRQAIDAFPSQTSEYDYASATLGLNRYRALRHLHGRGYAEAFMQMTPDDFRSLFSAASLKHAPK